MSILKYLTPKEAAGILNVSPPTIIAACCRGEFPNAKQVGPGKRWRIPLSDVTASTVKPAPERPSANAVNEHEILKRWGMA